MKKGLLIGSLGFFVLAGFGGGAFFAAQKGLVQIPGISPAKKAAKKPDEKPKVEVEAKKVTPPKPKLQEPPRKKETPTNDPAKGVEAIAGVWAGLKPDQLLPIASRYKDGELAEILLMMDARKTASLLALMPADRAAKLSRELQKRASIIESPEAG